MIRLFFYQSTISRLITSSKKMQLTYRNTREKKIKNKVFYRIRKESEKRKLLDKLGRLDE
jgi:UDP-N-acetylglucosamine 2-epimerase